MAESGAGVPDLLAIGVSRGGSSPANELVNEALMGLSILDVVADSVIPIPACSCGNRASSLAL
jgi:hypothetical protein